jgi:hypothetical protein
MSGKGSKPRPYSVTQQEYDNRWDAIFGKDKNDNTGTSKDEFYDVLSTEECVLDSDIEKISRYNEETQKIKRISP